MLDRRSFMMGTAGALAASPLLPSAALAADRSGYKALVCVMLLGGADTHDVLIGHDQPSYDAWADERRSILNNFEAGANPTARARDSLLRLDPLNAGQFGSRAFAMPPEMAPLKNLFDVGNMAFVPNVGPLIEPVTQQQVQDQTARLPAKIGSHNDQQSTWQAFSGEGAKAGWGGLILDAVGEISPYTAISARTQTVFLQGEDTVQLQVPSSGQFKRAYGMNKVIYGKEELTQLVRDYYSKSADHLSNPLMRDIIRAQGNAVANTEVLAELLSGPTIGDSIRIDGNGWSQQLATVADMIGLRSEFGLSRQVFQVSAGGWDTHKDQDERMPGLLGGLSQAIAAFQAAIDAAGLTDNVTLFTMSDFGRTLQANSSGTDHGWGGHHMVIGGAVRGQRIHGRVPEYTPGHDRDFKRGALIPEISVDQYGAELARWFGLTQGELDLVFPNRQNFDPGALQLFA